MTPCMYFPFSAHVISAADQDARYTKPLQTLDTDGH